MEAKLPLCSITDFRKRGDVLLCVKELLQRSVPGVQQCDLPEPCTRGSMEEWFNKALDAVTNSTLVKRETF